MVLEKTLESPLSSKETKPSILKEISPKARTDAETEALILRPLDVKN